MKYFPLLFILFLAPLSVHASEIRGRAVFDAVNAERTAHGLVALKPNGALVRAAQAKSDEMVREHCFAHNCVVWNPKTWRWEMHEGVASFAKAAGYKYRAIGQNLANSFEDMESLVAAWMASPTHRAIILDPAFVDAGVAMKTDANGHIFVTLYEGAKL